MAKFRDEVEIILSARDEATRELRKVQHTVAGDEFAIYPSTNVGALNL